MVQLQIILRAPESAGYKKEPTEYEDEGGL